MTSGIRVGTAAATTRGFTADEFFTIGQLIGQTVFNAENDAKLDEISGKVSELISHHPLYPEY